MSTVADIGHELKVPTQFIVRCNQSLSWRNNKLFIINVGILTLGIAGIFALQGLWLIVPFAGLEILALTIGLYICCLRNRYKEVITISDGNFIVEKGVKHPTEIWKFERAWVSLELQKPKHKGHPSKLLIRSKGNRIEVGACLTNKEKENLANSLGQILRKTCVNG